MSGKEFDKVKSIVEQEGFEYTFISYDNFLKIDDEKFHKLRLKFIAARNKLADYLGMDE